jgi:cell division transport system permease protein
MVEVLLLFVGYFSLSSHFEQSVSGGLITIRFFPLEICAAIIVCGVLVGGLGCLVSLKQFMRT